MYELIDLILYENENSKLDFKKEEYKKERFVSFLKDVLSMANSHIKQDRYIIIGLKPKSTEDRGITGIEGELTDSSTYQQLIFENIEPEISIDYFSYIFENKQLGVFKIYNCSNRPYLMKKDYGTGNYKLLKGEGYIRKGSHQTRLTRADYDKIIIEKTDEKYFTDEIDINFITDKGKNQIELISFEDIKRPSQIKKEKIQQILDKRKEVEEQNQRMGFPNIEPINHSMHLLHAVITNSGVPYENRSTDELKKNLEKIEETYFEHDLYEVFEKKSHKCNITIFNYGNKYIEKASAILKVPKIDGLIVVKEIYRDPTNNIGIVDGLNYPEIIEDDDCYIVKDDIGDVKHQLEQEAFSIPIRIFASQQISLDTLEFKFELYAKNIKTNIRKNLEIKITNGNRGKGESHP
ncbi:helix-turn-helix domain-containing protein [Belliella marina]|uniref:Helix-turn-helix domain-containing protein n=1 Tax=Belliella marina TaxID=1644146 RepID=A0ABW4VS90_9BACT